MNYFRYSRLGAVVAAVMATFIIPAAQAQERQHTKLQNVTTNRCLNVHAGRENRDGGFASVYQCSATFDQVWEMRPTGEPNTFRLINASTNKCLQLDSRAENRDGGIVTVGICDDTADQNWIVRTAGDTKTISHEVTSKCLNIHAGRDNRDGGRVTVYRCANSSDQKWITTNVQSPAASCGKPARFSGERLWLENCYVHMFELNGTPREITVYWTDIHEVLLDPLRAVDRDGDGAVEVEPDDMALWVAAFMQEAWMTFDRYGFGEPSSNRALEAHIFEIGKPGWCCRTFADGHKTIEISADTTRGGFLGADNGRNLTWLRSVVHHEMWHALKDNGDLSRSEGLAELMTDHVSGELDASSTSGFAMQARAYLSGKYKETLNIHDYEGALFWKYFTEQLTPLDRRPKEGIDALLPLWEMPNSASIEALRRAVQTSGTGLDLDTLWTDFTIANYVKDLANINRPVPAPYVYADEAHSPDYPAPADPILLSGDLTMRGVIEGTVDMPGWSAQYWQLDRPARGRRYLAQFDIAGGDGAVFTLVTARRDAVDIQPLGAGDFEVDLLNEDGTVKYVIIGTGLPESATTRVTYRFEALP